MIPTERGGYDRFYDEFAVALTTGGPLPVDPEDAAGVVELIEHIYAIVRIRRRHESSRAITREDS